MMKLNYLPTNQAYVFTCEGKGMRMGADRRLVFAARMAAVEAARFHGLVVSSTGEVS